MTIRPAILSLAAAACVAPGFGHADPTFDFYGQVNWGIFHVDDGTDSETFVTDNDVSNTRVGLIYSNDLSAGGTLKFHFETALGIDGSATATMTDTDSDVDLKRTELRKLEVIYDSPAAGRFYAGQGSMSTDGVAEADFSGTGVVASSAINDLAGSFAFRPPGGALSSTDIGDAFSNFDGARRFRLRYDTPNIAGFVFSVSYGEEELNQRDDREFTDLAAKYFQDYGDLRVEARLGYQFIEDGADDEEILLGSAAILHEPTGISLALSSAAQDEGDAEYIFAKLGYQQEFFAFGKTFLTVDFYSGSDFAMAGSDSESYAVSAVQTVDAYNLEIFASYRVYDYDAPGEVLDDIDLMVVGARWKF